MGRTLETLKFGEGRKGPQAVPKPLTDAPVQDCVVDWEIGAEVPYVEVGGPDRKVELSPGLLKHPPQAAQPPHGVVHEKKPTETAAKVVQLTPAPPLSVAYEPWPTGAGAA